MSEAQKYPYVEIRGGDFTERRYSYQLRLWTSPNVAEYRVGFAYSLRNARSKAKRMLAAHVQLMKDEKFREEVRL